MDEQPIIFNPLPGDEAAATTGVVGLETAGAPFGEDDVLTVSVPVSPPIGVASVTFGSCTITGATCTLVGSTPAGSPPNPPFPARPVFFNLTFNFTFTGNALIKSGSGTSTGTFKVMSLQTVTLYAPPGVKVVCLLNASCKIITFSANSVTIRIDGNPVFQTVWDDTGRTPFVEVGSSFGVFAFDRALFAVGEAAAPGSDNRPLKRALPRRGPGLTGRGRDFPALG